MPTSPSKISTASPRIGPLIRARRRKLGMTLQALSAGAGVSISYLSMIERDQATPSLGTLSQIARHLDVDLAFFVSMPGLNEALTRSKERPKFSVSGSTIVYERVAADFAGNVLSSFVLNIPPGYQSEMVSHEGEELLFVLEGSIVDYLDGEEMTLRAGDSLHFRGNRPHAWANRSGRISRVLWTGTLPMFRSRGEQSPPEHVQTEGIPGKSAARASTSAARKPNDSVSKQSRRRE